MDPAWLTALTALVVAVLTGGAVTGRVAWRGIRRISRFLDDYTGEPAAGGNAARPGFMARLAAVEEGLAHVVAETTPNGGKTIKDLVTRAASDITEIRADQTAMRTRMELFEHQRAGREGQGSP